MARPTKKNPKGAQKSPKKTEEVLSKLDYAFAIDCSIVEACLYAGISETTYHRWVGEDSKLKERFDRQKQATVLKAKVAVHEKVDQSYSNAMDYLSRKQKKQYSTRQEMTGADGEELKQVTKIIVNGNQHRPDAEADAGVEQSNEQDG